jgi:hypothetical protein
MMASRKAEWLATLKQQTESSISRGRPDYRAASFFFMDPIVVVLTKKSEMDGIRWESN